MIGNTLIELDRVDSTNEYANRMLNRDDLDDGVVIWAYDQYSGKGQQQHAWQSEAGKNLTLTVILKPWFLSPDRQFQLNKAITLGVVDFIRKSLGKIPVSIKWPNDIYLGSQKVGGILIENRILGNRLEYALVGIGLNINQITFDGALPNPISMIHHLRHEMKLREALHSLLISLDLRYRKLVQDESADLDEEFNQNLFGFGQWRRFSKGNEPFEGRIRGVDECGRLCIETGDGEILCFHHKEVEYIL
ncbi:MAG TPA: biotin--[acetyl-CoA-carboxylase] ligase [Bacteroidales bacterium]|nr:biotin--[acetyl-CoA-carboxylase] ligase [Bacteroidales bacterium]